MINKDNIITVGFWLIVIIGLLYFRTTDSGSEVEKSTDYRGYAAYDVEDGSEATKSPIQNQSSYGTFNGYSCTVDCSGHEAGYEWADENGIDDPDDCDGNSNSFIEGCQSYAEEQQDDYGDDGDYYDY